MTTAMHDEYRQKPVSLAVISVGNDEKHPCNRVRDSVGQMWPIRWQQRKLHGEEVGRGRNEDVEMDVWR